MVIIKPELLEYVLTVGPYKGQRIGEAVGLLNDNGTWKAVDPRMLWACKVIDWMGWYLSHHATWLANSGIVAADRQQIAVFLTSCKECYNVEPYRSWALI